MNLSSSPSLSYFNAIRKTICSVFGYRKFTPVYLIKKHEVVLAVHYVELLQLCDIIAPSYRCTEISGN